MEPHLCPCMRVRGGPGSQAPVSPSGTGRAVSGRTGLGFLGLLELSPITWGLSPQKPILPQSGGQESGVWCQRGRAVSEGSRGGLFLPLPAAGGCLHPWLEAASLRSLPLSSRDPPPRCLWVSGFSLDELPGSSLTSSGLGYLCPDPFPQSGHFHIYRGVGH